MHTPGFHHEPNVPAYTVHTGDYLVNIGDVLATQVYTPSDPTVAGFATTVTFLTGNSQGVTATTVPYTSKVDVVRPDVYPPTQSPYDPEYR